MGTRIKFVIALFMGLFAALIVVLYLQSQEELYRGRGQLVPVMVATRDIGQWQKMDDTMFETHQVPEAYRQPGSFLDQDKQKIVGQVATVPIKKDEQILVTKLAEGREQSIASILAASGYTRTVTIGISGDAGVAGMLKPTDIVDIVGQFNYNVGGRKVEEVRYFEQNVLILALDQQTGFIKPKPGEGQQNLQYGSATLAVSPDNVLRILLASRIGSLYFTLRPAGDAHKPENIEPLTVEKLLGNQFPIWREADERKSFMPTDLLKQIKPGQ